MNRLCPTEELLSEYLAGTLSGEERELVEKHLASCDKCRTLLAEAHAILETPDLHEIFFNLKKWLRKNTWLIIATASLIASFFFREYFLQLLTAALLSGIKWTIDSRTTKMLITVYEAWKKNSADKSDSIFSDIKKK
jgi:hypothetical protein